MHAYKKTKKTNKRRAESTQKRWERDSGESEKEETPLLLSLEFQSKKLGSLAEAACEDSLKARASCNW